MIKTIKIAKETLDKHKAEDIIVYDVKGKNPFYDYCILASATNIRLLEALSEYLVQEFEKNKILINHVEGKPESGWILIDADSVVVNIFTQEERKRISLEELLTK